MYEPDGRWYWETTSEKIENSVFHKKMDLWLGELYYPNKKMIVQVDYKDGIAEKAQFIGKLSDGSDYLIREDLLEKFSSTEAHCGENGEDCAEKVKVTYFYQNQQPFLIYDWDLSENAWNNGSCTEYHEALFFYNEDGTPDKTEKKYYCVEEDQLTFIIDYERSDGSLEKRSEYKRAEDGSTREKIYSKYDRKGRIIEEILYNEKLEYEKTFTYNNYNCPARVDTKTYPDYPDHSRECIETKLYAYPTCEEIDFFECKTK